MNTLIDARTDRPGSAASAAPQPKRPAGAWKDLREGLGMYELWVFLGWRDVQKHYKRSLIGPLWLTLSMGIMVFSLGVLYSQIFAMDISAYLPFLAIGLILWGFIGSLINAACTVFSGAAGSIQQIRLPLSVYVYQFVWSQVITFAHNFLIYIAVAVVFSLNPGWTVLLFVPAFGLYVLNGIFIALILGPICARFRDIPMIVGSVMQIVFFMTPILWSAQQIPQRASFVSFNPFYHFIEIARDPLLGNAVSLHNWYACLAITAVMGAAATLFFGRYRKRITYWA